MVLSATLLLLLPTYPSHPDDCRRLSRQLRDVQWNPAPPARGRPRATGARELSREKAAWIARQPGSGPERRERYRRLFDLTRGLRPFIHDDEVSLQRQQERCAHEVAANAILQRRDYSVCLFPEAMLRACFEPWLAV